MTIDANKSIKNIEEMVQIFKKSASKIYHHAISDDCLQIVGTLHPFMKTGIDKNDFVV